MSSHRKTIGQVEIVSLSDGSMEQEPHSVFPAVPESVWRGFLRDGKFTMNFGCYLLCTPALTVLVDTGVGGPLLQELASQGVTLADIQAVTYTHLHGDHIAWNLSGSGQDQHVTFPNATWYVPRGDWEYFVEPSSPGYSASVHEKFRPLEEQGRVQLVDDGDALSPELTVTASPGHTPGHCCITIESQGQCALIVGDALIHPIQVSTPDWNSRYDQDPETAAQTRRSLVEEMERKGALGGVSHFEPPGFGRVTLQGHQRKWVSD
jgi:glyoxylase-like metal-dependent hydrolase (beta-lactamase superfamily II)